MLAILRDGTSDGIPQRLAPAGFHNRQLGAQFGDGEDGRIASYTLRGTAYEVGYDPASRISSIAQSANPANVNSYGYDALDRLTQAVLPSVSYAYSYDPTGNRLTKSAGASTDTYAYPGTSNRLSSITHSSGPVTSFAHDAAGSMTGDGTLQGAYDARGRLVRAFVGGCTVARYRVNALGQRVRKMTWALSPCQPELPADPPERDTLYTYDLAGRLIAENHSFGLAYKRAYIYLHDLPVGMVFVEDN